MTKPMISKDTEVTWRTEMVKSTLQLHARPTAEAVKAYHRHLLAEFEALATSQVPKKGGSGNPAPNLALKAMDGNAGGGQGGGAKGGGKGKIQCKYFLSQKGCKYGSNCKNVHSMNELSKGDRFKKCLNCGSEEHRAKDCDRPNKAGKSGPNDQNPKSGAQVAHVTPSPSAASTSQTIVQATPVLSPDLLQQAAEMYQAMQVPQAIQPLSLPAPQATQPLSLPAPTPAESTSQQPSSTSQPSIKRLAITSIMPASCFSSSHLETPNLGCPNPTSRAETGGLGGPDFPKPIAYALLDSGATHPMRQAKDQHEWDDALEVQVSLAGDNSTLMRLTQSGTLLLPPLERAGSVQPIVPMGAVIEQLGYSLVWSAGSCKLYPPNDKALRLRVKNGCPEVVERQALTLISRFEEHKLQQVEELRRRTEQGKDRIRQAKLAMDKTWWDHLVDYVSSPNIGSGQMAVSTAPFFQEVPDKALQGILPPRGVDAEPFWDAIKRALPHLNRRRRKALHQSKNWVVHLFAGAKSHKPLMKLESDDTVVLELDIQRSAAQNVYNDALWSLLLRAAQEGRLAAVLGGPPCRTMSVLRHRPGDPRPVRSPAEPFGLSTLAPSERELVDRDTGLFARMLWLRATSTAGRRVHRPQPHFSSMVAFLLEQPQQVERYMAPGNPLLGEVPSWWSNPMWLSYAAEAGLFEVDFNQGPLGHVSDKPTTIGTNLPDLRDLQGLKGDPKGPWSGDSKLLAEWAPGFAQAIARALQTWPRYRLVRMTPAEMEATRCQ